MTFVFPCAANNNNEKEQKIKAWNIILSIEAISMSV